MCKIIVLTNASKINTMPEFSRLAAKLLSDQKDGFGAAMHGINGVYSVKTLYPLRYAHSSKVIPWTKQAADEYSGVSSPHYTAAMFHGRVSTNVVSLLNTHPMRRGDTYLIHNGVVGNEGDKYTKATSNDSEDVLHHYVTGGIDKVAKSLSGYYACAVINPDGTLSVFRDAIASLHCAWSDKLETYIFATTESIIHSIGEHIKEELDCAPVKDCVYLKFKGNEVIEEKSFTALGWANAHSRASSAASIGRGWGDWGDNDDAIPYKATEFVTEEYLDEMDTVDDTYTIYDHDDRLIDADTFFYMTLDDKLACTVIRPNGVTVNPFQKDAAYG